MKVLLDGITAAISAIVLCSSSIAGQPPGALVLADSVEQFSGTQGADGWSYGYWEQTTDKKYDSSTDFRLLKNYGHDPINRLSSNVEFKTGKLWNLEDGRSYVSLWAEGGHAHSSTREAKRIDKTQWAVRRWTSNTKSAATIRGRIGKVMPWGKNWGGNCRAIITVDGQDVFTSTMNEKGLDYAVKVELQQGTKIDFLIGPNPSIGVVQFTAKIESQTCP